MSQPSHKSRRLLVLGVAVVLSASFPAASSRQDDEGEGRPSILAVSTRPDRVSGGDVLVELNGADRRKQPVDVKVNGRDVSATFGPGPRPNTLIGLITGLDVGRNKISA